MQIPPLRPAATRAFVIILAIVAMLLGTALGTSALTGLGFALVVMVLVARRLASRSLAGVDVRRELYPSAFEQDTVDVQLVVENRSGRELHLLEVSDRFSPSLAGRHVMLESGPLGDARQRTLAYTGACGRQWGIYDVGPLSLATHDPLGLFRQEVLKGGIEDFAVFPRVFDIPWLNVRGARGSLVPQEASQARPGQGALYLGVRDYVAGDEQRRVHWPASARRGRPMVREHELDLVPYVTLLIDLSSRSRAGTGMRSVHEFVVRTASSVLWTAMRQGAVFQAFAETTARSLVIEPGAGRDHFIASLFEIIHLDQSSKLDVLELAAMHAANAPAGSALVIVASSVDMDIDALESFCEGEKAAGKQPWIFAVNNHSFRQLEGFVTPPDVVRKRLEDLDSLLARQEIGGMILNRHGEKGEEVGVQLERGAA